MTATEAVSAIPRSTDMTTTLRRTRAAVITRFNEPLEVRDVQVPELDGGAMLAQVEAATLCGTDVHRWHGQA